MCPDCAESIAYSAVCDRDGPVAEEVAFGDGGDIAIIGLPAQVHAVRIARPGRVHKWLRTIRRARPGDREVANETITAPRFAARSWELLAATQP